jgi:diguanylate cyclase (GGDEF)-like protein
LDDRIAFLKQVVTARIERIAPTACLESACGYGYPDAQQVFKTAPGAEIERLEELANLGYLRAEFHDKIHICPTCSHHALNFRELCPQCQSANISIVQMIHHLRCGYVSTEREFQDGMQLRCPKCKHSLRHIGIDYERPSASFLCGACRFIFSEPKVSCLSLKCGQSFPVDRVPTRTIYSYVPTAKAAVAAETGMLQDSAAPGLIDPEFVVYTQQFFDEMLQQQLRTCSRYNRDVSILLISFDHVAEYLQAFGHQAASQMQKNLARVIKEALRDSDMAAMLADDVLGIILVDTNASGARATAERLCQHAYQQNPAGQQAKITLSIGIGWYSKATADATAILASAQQAVKQASEAGGNSVEPSSISKPAPAPSQPYRLGVNRRIHHRG